MTPLFPVAHVRYVQDDDVDPAAASSIQELFHDVAATHWSMAIVAASLLGLVAYVILVPRLPGFGRFRTALVAALDDYHAYLPWVLRLSAGIALLGAGVAAYAFAPHIKIESRTPYTFALLAAGFFLLLGVGVRFWAFVGIMAWGWAFVLVHRDALMAIEVVAALLTLTAISAGRPSLDDLLARSIGAAPGPIGRGERLKVLFGPDPDADVSIALATWVPVVLRVGLGASIVYAGFVEKLWAPAAAFGVAERYGLAFGPVEPAAVVATAGLVEVFLGIALIVGLATRPVAALAFLVFTITLFALPDDPVVGHVSLWGTASAVFILGAGPKSVDRWLSEAVTPRDRPPAV